MRQSDHDILDDLDLVAGETDSQELHTAILSIREKIKLRLQDANDFENAFDEIVSVVDRTLVANKRLQTTSKRLIETLKGD